MIVPSPYLAEISLLGTVLIWGGNFVVSKVAMNYFPPSVFVTVRYVMATPLLFLLLKLREEKAGIDCGELIPLAFLGLTGVAMYQMFFIHAVAYTTATNASLLNNTSPLFGAVLTVVSRQEKASLVKYAGMLLAFFGVAAFIGTSSLPLGGRHFLGDALGLAGAACFAVYSTLSVPILRKHSPLKVTAYAALFGTVVLLALNLVQVVRLDWQQVPASGWLALMYTTVLSTVFAFVAWYTGLKAVGATGAMVYQYLVPVVGALCSVIFLGEVITLKQAAAGLIVISGIALVKGADGRQTGQTQKLGKSHAG
ncbi:membrane protein [Gelria sp. Kuro-4]|nr:membrane protein [Gelria sp. Kuro-4]